MWYNYNVTRYVFSQHFIDIFRNVLRETFPKGEGHECI